MNSKKLILSLLSVLMLAALSACGSGKKAGACASDAECTLPGTRCDLEQQLCVCASDEACETGFFCNLAGVCQEKTGCSKSSECEEDSYCDIQTGECRLVDAEPKIGSICSLATHCPFGAVCTGGSCQEGCYDDGDCLLGEICFEGQCGTGNGVCNNNGFCEYGELCTSNLCTTDRRGPYCRGCTQRTSMNPEPCDHPRNFCLINSAELGGFTNFCGIDCSLGQECPNGYGCNGVVILTESVCTFNAQCKCDPNQISFPKATCRIDSTCAPKLPNGQPDPNASNCVVQGAPECNGGQAGGSASCIVRVGSRDGNCTCASDSDCDNGAACVDGVCCGGNVREERQCSVGEGRVSGFCTCATDGDCPRDVCDPSRSACRITGHPCTPGNNDCPPIPCVDGGCLIGQNCAPLQGLSCSEVKGG